MKGKGALGDYLVALVVTALALSAWYLLSRVLGADVPLLVFLPAVMLATRYGGVGPGLIAIALSALAAVVFAHPESASPAPQSPALVRLILFFLVGLFAAWSMEALRSAKRQSAASARARREAEERFRLLVEGVQDYALFMMDPEGRVVSWNPGVQRILGYDEEEIVGLPVSRLFTPDDVARGVPEQELRTAEKEGRASDDRWHVRKDGSRFFASGVVHPLRDEAGNLRGFAKVLQDVTARKAAEDEIERLNHGLEQRLDELQTLLDVVPIGIALARDPQCREITSNRWLSEFLKVPPGHNISKSAPAGEQPPYRTYHQGREVPAEELPLQRAALQRTEVRDFDMEIVAGGRKEPRQLVGHAKPLFDEQGNVRGAVGAFMDITERKRAEHVLRGRAAALTSMQHALTAKPDLQTFLGQVVATVADVLQAASVSLWLRDADRDVWYPRAAFDCGHVLAPDEPGCSTASAPLLANEVPVWQDIDRTRKPVAIEDVAENPHITNREWLLARGIRTMLLVPLLLEDRVIGALSICRTDTRPYPPGEIELAQALAQQATLAVQLTRLAEQGGRAAVLEERNRLAREIHDTLAQGFTGIVVQLEGADYVLPESPDEAKARIQRARELARESLAEARRSVRALRPQALEHSSLPGAFARHLEQMTAHTPVQAGFHVHGRARPLPPELENQFLRIGLEALTNALKHARASVIRVDLFFEPEQVRLSVQDNGQGFDPQAQSASDGFGLTGMRERAEHVGGRLDLSSRPGQGTEVTVTAPTPRAGQTGVDPWLETTAASAS